MAAIERMFRVLAGNGLARHILRPIAPSRNPVGALAQPGERGVVGFKTGKQRKRPEQCEHGIHCEFAHRRLAQQPRRIAIRKTGELVDRGVSYAQFIDASARQAAELGAVGDDVRRLMPMDSRTDTKTAYPSSR